MAKHILNSANDDLDFALIGLTSPEDQYSLISILDTALDTNFRLSDFLSYNLAGDRIFQFSLYLHRDEMLGLDCYLLPNTSNFEQPDQGKQAPGLFSGIEIQENLRLVKELPKTDYFILLKGEETSTHLHRILEKLKNVPEIIQAIAINQFELPSRRNLVF